MWRGAGSRAPRRDRRRNRSAQTQPETWQTSRQPSPRLPLPEGEPAIVYYVLTPSFDPHGPCDSRTHGPGPLLVTPRLTTSSGQHPQTQPNAGQGNRNGEHPTDPVAGQPDGTSVRCHSPCFFIVRDIFSGLDRFLACISHVRYVFVAIFGAIRPRRSDSARIRHGSPAAASPCHAPCRWRLANSCRRQGSPIAIFAKLFEVLPRRRPQPRFVRPQPTQALHALRRAARNAHGKTILLLPNCPTWHSPTIAPNATCA